MSVVWIPIVLIIAILLIFAALQGVFAALRLALGVKWSHTDVKINDLCSREADCISEFVSP